MLLRARARLSALLVSLSSVAPAAPALLSRRAGAASNDAVVAKGAIAGVGGLALGLKACASSADDVARAGMVGGRALSGGGRAAGELSHVGGALDDVGRAGARSGGAVLDDAGRVRPVAAGHSVDEGGRAGLVAEEGGGAGHAVDATGHAVDLGSAVVDGVGGQGDDGGDGTDRPATGVEARREARPARAVEPGVRPEDAAARARWVGRWSDGVRTLSLRPGSDSPLAPPGRGLSGTLQERGERRMIVGHVDPQGGLDGWVVVRDATIHVWGTLRADGSIELRRMTETFQLQPVR